MTNLNRAIKYMSPELVKKIISSLVKLTIAILLLCFALWLPIWYMARPINNFCNSLIISSSYQDLISKAQHLRYRISNRVNEKSGAVFVVAKETPFFRMTCVVTIEDNLIVKKQVRAAD